jgi:hypothetical protein
VSRLRAFVCLTVALLAGPALLSAQAAPASSASSVKFELKFPGSNPESYVIEIQSDGRAAYDSMARMEHDSDGPTAFHWDFSISSPGRGRIFMLAREAKYFAGKLDSERKLAFTGQKTLTYADSKAASSGTYNYSDIKPIQELTSYFESVSLTLEFIRRMDDDLRFQKLALDTELKNLEEQVVGHEVEEMQAAAPILQKIAADPSVMKTARARAQRLLDRRASNN